MNHTGRKTWQSGPIVQLYPNVNQKNRQSKKLLVRETSYRKGKQKYSTSENVNKSSTEISSAPAVHHHVHERIMFHQRESTRLIQLDTQDPVHLDAQGAIDQDLARSFAHGVLS